MKKSTVTAVKLPPETVFIPKRGRNDNERYVAVNGKRILVKCGEAVTVPAEFAQVIKNGLKMDALSDAFISENRRED